MSETLFLANLSLNFEFYLYYLDYTMSAFFKNKNIISEFIKEITYQHDHPTQNKKKFNVADSLELIKFIKMKY